MSSTQPNSSELSVVFSFVARLQQGTSTRTAFVGTNAGEITDTFEEYHPTPIVRWADGEPTAAAFVDYDEEQHRAWLWGPWIEASDWHAVAEDLWDEAAKQIPSGATQIEISWASDNHNVADFARRHDFKQFSDGHLMGFKRARLAQLPESEEVIDLPAHLHVSLSALHDSLFPGVWLNGKQMIERIDERRSVLVAVDQGGSLLGYVHVEVKAEFGEAGIEFVGVAEEARGRGIGGTLIASALRWIFSHDSIDEIELFVRKDNPAAAALYTHIGFEKGVRLMGARKQLD